MKWIFCFVMLVGINAIPAADPKEEFSIKDNESVSKFERITFNEKAIKKLVKRVNKLEAQVKKLDAKMRSQL